MQLEKALGIAGRLYYWTSLANNAFPFPETIEVEVDDCGCGAMDYCDECNPPTPKSNAGRQIAYPDPSEPPTPTEPVEEGKRCDGQYCAVRWPHPPHCVGEAPEPPRPVEKENKACGDFHPHYMDANLCAACGRLSEKHVPHPVPPEVPKPPKMEEITGDAYDPLTFELRRRVNQLIEDYNRRNGHTS